MPTSAVSATKLTKPHRVRYWAVGLLVLNLMVWLISLWGQRIHPDWHWIGYVKAFAEAACIGGLADWFAVVALFRHPMGIPLPHTAVLSNKQEQLAQGVANFIGTHFLDAHLVAEQIRRYQVGERVSAFAQNRLTVEMVEQHTPAVLRAVWDKIPSDAPTEWLQLGQKTLIDWANGERLGKGAARLIGWAQAEHTDRWLIRRLAQALHDFCSADDAAERLRPWLSELAQQVQQENADWWDKLKARMTGQAVDWLADWLIEKVIVGGKGLAQRVLDDDDHPIQLWFSAQCLDWRRQLSDNPQAHQWLAQHAQAGLGSAVFHDWLAQLWRRAHQRLDDMAQAGTPQIAFIARTVHQTLMAQLAQPMRREQLTQAVSHACEQILATQQENLRNWIASQLNTWSKERLTDALNTAIGNDLQYIRINGTLIGGLIGLILYGVGMMV